MKKCLTIYSIYRVIHLSGCVSSYNMSEDSYQKYRLLNETSMKQQAYISLKNAGEKAVLGGMLMGIAGGLSGIAAGMIFKDKDVFYFSKNDSR